jgi:hypothetical protein
MMRQWADMLDALAQGAQVQQRAHFAHAGFHSTNGAAARAP